MCQRNQLDSSQFFHSFYFQYSITNSKNLMHYSTINSSHVSQPIYTDRSTDRNSHLESSWAKTNHPHPHLNPSKSKLNVKQFLNKSGESSSLSQSNLDSIRGSCFLANPPKPQHVARDNFFDEINNPPTKLRHEMSFELASKDCYPKFNYNPTTINCLNDRKKSQSNFLRSSMRENHNFRQDEQNNCSREEKAIIELRSQIISLTKKVFMNEEEIQKLKEKKQKSKNMQTLEQQFTQFQIQMFDICKKNTNYFSDFQDKIEKNTRLLGEVKDRCNDLVNKEVQKQEISKRLNLCESRITDLCETMKLREDLTIKNIAAQLNNEQAMMKKYVYEQLTQIKAKFQTYIVQKNQILKRFEYIQKDLIEKRIEQCFKKDSIKAYNSMIIQSKESILVKEGQLIKDRTNQFVNQQISSKKEFRQSGFQQLSRNKSEMKISSKEEFHLQPSTYYYIDPFGYLLDENQYYLLNSNNQHILLPEKILMCLRQNNMLIIPGRGIK